MELWAMPKLGAIIWVLSCHIIKWYAIAMQYFNQTLH